MTIAEIARRRFRFSIRSLMIAVLVCAFLLTPIAWLVRQNALLRAEQLRAAAYRQRAVVLGERARAEFLARTRAGNSTREPANAEGAPDPRTERGLWAGLAVNHAVFPSGETSAMQLEFTLTNDGDRTLDPQIGQSRIIINGEELSDPGLLFNNGPRDSRFRALPPGATLQFAYALGSHFEKPGVYRVWWRGEQFRSPEVVFRVLTDEGPAPDGR
jgi:hypothetical protein